MKSKKAAGGFFRRALSYRTLESGSGSPAKLSSINRVYPDHPKPLIAPVMVLEEQGRVDRDQAPGEFPVGISPFFLLIKPVDLEPRTSKSFGNITDRIQVFLLLRGIEPVPFHKTRVRLLLLTPHITPGPVVF